MDLKQDRADVLFDSPISTETYALIRFGTGYPARGAPLSGEAILERLNGPDTMATAIPHFPFQQALSLAFGLHKARSPSAEMAMSENPVRDARTAIQEQRVRNMLDDLARSVETDDPFRERLLAFWGDHFTVVSPTHKLRAGVAGYHADAIRPHLTGRFADMLKAVATHPMMLFYLDQRVSIGPNSEVGLASGKGLNENFARELLELHTIGVDAVYAQSDVRELAELLTGISADYKRGFRLRDTWIEPGPETVLGKVYGGEDVAPLDAIHNVLEDLAVHPATAAHLSYKLARHFVADDPDAGLVAHMTEAYRGSDGQLSAVYAAMLEHPAAWANFGAKAKRPVEFIITAMRAVGLREDEIRGIRIKAASKGLGRALARMGQAYDQPPGPNGWSDTSSDWINAHGIAGRISWALSLPKFLNKRKLPDPRSFVYDTLNDASGSRLRFAATAAETRAVGIALVLASAEFNRR